MDPGGAEKKVVRVTIFNQSYTLRAPGDPREIEELAKQIDGLMESIASRSGDSEASRIAVLACLHLADRLRTLERQFANLTERVEQKSEQLSLLLDQAIEGKIGTQNSELRIAAPASSACRTNRCWRPRRPCGTGSRFECRR